MSHQCSNILLHQLAEVEILLLQIHLGLAANDPTNIYNQNFVIFRFFITPLNSIVGSNYVQCFSDFLKILIIHWIEFDCLL